MLMVSEFGILDLNFDPYTIGIHYNILRVIRILQ